MSERLSLHPITTVHGRAGIDNAVTPGGEFRLCWLPFLAGSYERAVVDDGTWLERAC